jgi:O-antigen/teichoic acid export membrane protein
MFSLKSLQNQLHQFLGDAIFKRLVKNSSLLFSAQMIVTLIGVIQFPLISRWLGANDYGIWGIVNSWVGIVSLFLSFRLWETVIRFFNKYLGANDEGRALAVLKLCVWIDVIVNVVILLVVVLTAEWVSPFILKRPDGASLIRLEAIHSFMLVTMSIWMAILRVFDRFKFISIYNVASSIALFVLSVGTLVAGGGIAGLIIASTLVTLGQTLVLGWRAERELRARFQPHWFSADLNLLRGEWREIWVMLFSLNINTFRKLVTNNADIVVIGWLSTPAQAGIYQLAERLSSYFGRFTDPVYDSIFPEVSRLYAAEGPRQVKPLTQRVTRVMLFALVAFIGGAYLFSGWLIPLIFGSEYVPAIPVFYVAVLANIWTVLLWAPSVLIAAGKVKQLTAINIISSLVMLVLLFVLTKHWGSLGAAMAQVAYHLTWLSLMYPATRKALSES